MQNRTREKQIVIRMNEKEYAQIKNKVAQSGLKQQDYLIRALTNKKITVIDGIKELTIELKRIGNNVNQIARACNEDRADCKEEIKQVESELSGIWQLLRQLVQKQV